MGYLISRLQEKNLVKLDLESNNTSLFIKEVLSSKRYTTELTYFQNSVISKFFGEGTSVCCYELFYNENEILSKRLV